MTAPQSSARLELVYPIDQVKQPIIYHLVADYNLVPNIRRARIDAHTGGMMVLDIEGTNENIARAIAYLTALGITVSEIGTAESWDI